MDKPIDIYYVYMYYVIIYLGKSTSDAQQTVPQANLAQQEGVRMFAVGVTTSIVKEELRLLSSDPRLLNQTYFMSTDFEGLQNVLETLLSVSIVCVWVALVPIHDIMINNQIPIGVWLLIYQLQYRPIHQQSDG